MEFSTGRNLSFCLHVHRLMNNLSTSEAKGRLLFMCQKSIPWKLQFQCLEELDSQVLNYFQLRFICRWIVKGNKDIKWERKTEFINADIAIWCPQSTGFNNLTTDANISSVKTVTMDLVLFLLLCHTISSLLPDESNSTGQVV